MRHFIRTTTAFVIALSLALLPGFGSTAVSAKTAPIAASTEMAALTDDHCAHHADHAKSCDHRGDECTATSWCGSVTLANGAISHFAYPLASGKRLPMMA